MKLLNKIFPELNEIESIKAERDSLADLVETLREAEAAAILREKKLYQQQATLKDELRQTREKLRDQTDADLLLVSQRITAKILEGDKPDNGDVDRQNSLMTQRASIQSQLNASNQQMAFGNGLANVFGLGGIF